MRLENGWKSIGLAVNTTWKQCLQTWLRSWRVWNWTRNCIYPPSTHSFPRVSLLAPSQRFARARFSFLTLFLKTRAHPRVVHETKMLRLWHKCDDQFASPKSTTLLLLRRFFWGALNYSPPSALCHPPLHVLHSSAKLWRSCWRKF